MIRHCFQVYSRPRALLLTLALFDMHRWGTTSRDGKRGLIFLFVSEDVLGPEPCEKGSSCKIFKKRLNDPWPLSSASTIELNTGGFAPAKRSWAGGRFKSRFSRRPCCPCSWIFLFLSHEAAPKHRWSPCFHLLPNVRFELSRLICWAPPSTEDMLLHFQVPPPIPPTACDPKHWGDESITNSGSNLPDPKPSDGWPWGPTLSAELLVRTFSLAAKSKTPKGCNECVEDFSVFPNSPSGPCREGCMVSHCPPPALLRLLEHTVWRTSEVSSAYVASKPDNSLLLLHGLFDDISLDCDCDLTSNCLICSNDCFCCSFDDDDFSPGDRLSAWQALLVEDPKSAEYSSTGLLRSDLVNSKPCLFSLLPAMETLICLCSFLTPFLQRYPRRASSFSFGPKRPPDQNCSLLNSRCSKSLPFAAVEKVEPFWLGGPTLPMRLHMSTLPLILSASDFLWLVQEPRHSEGDNRLRRRHAAAPVWPRLKRRSCRLIENCWNDRPPLLLSLLLPLLSPILTCTQSQRPPANEANQRSWPNEWRLVCRAPPPSIDLDRLANDLMSKSFPAKSSQSGFKIVKSSPPQARKFTPVEIDESRINHWTTAPM